MSCIKMEKGSKVIFTILNYNPAAFILSTVYPVTLTGILLIVKRSSARGLDGGVLQLARKTSPGSYRVCSVKS